MSTIISLAFIGFLAYRNGFRARLKGKSIGLFSFLTVLLFFVGEFFGVLLVIMLFHRDLLTYSANMSATAMNEMQQRMLDVFQANPFHALTVELFGIGGYLLIRYIIQQFPDKSDKMPLWPGGGDIS